MVIDLRPPSPVIPYLFSLLKPFLIKFDDHLVKKYQVKNYKYSFFLSWPSLTPWYHWDQLGSEVVAVGKINILPPIIWSFLVHSSTSDEVNNAEV